MITRTTSLLSTAIVATCLIAAPAASAHAGDVEGRNEALKRAFTSVGAAASEHVVQLKSSRGSSIGYAVAVKGEGGATVFVTALSTVAKADGLRLAPKGGGTFDAKVLKRDEDLALALLAAVDDPEIDPIELGTVASIEPGAWLISVGNADIPVAVGVLSAKGREVLKSERQANLGIFGLFGGGDNKGPQRHYDAVLQHDSPITKEIFGSAVVGEDGKLVGINVDNVYRGSSYAIGVERVRALIDGVEPPKPAKRPARIERPAPRETEKPAEPKGNRPFLGIAIEERAEANGDVSFICDSIVAGGPAAKLGIKKGDRILSVEGKTYGSLEELGAVIGGKKPGDVLKMKVEREGFTRDFEITLGRR